jgi:hypothetical protein
MSVVTKSVRESADTEARVQKKSILNFVLNFKETDHVLELCLDGKHAITETRCEYENWNDAFVTSSSHNFNINLIQAITNIIHLS